MHKDTEFFSFTRAVYEQGLLASLSLRTEYSANNVIFFPVVIRLRLKKLISLSFNSYSVSYVKQSYVK